MNYIKPHYFSWNDIHYVVLAFKSMHEDDDWMVIVREENYKNDYMRLTAESAEHAIKKAVERTINFNEMNQIKPFE
jgi:tripartite-type tricarboxylate transporter receptor subunit TctC